MTPDPFYQRLAGEPGAFAVLELPFGLVVGPSVSVGRSETVAQTEFFQTVHGKSLLGGYVARERPALADSVQNCPGLGWLATNGAASPSEQDRNAPLVRGTFASLNIRYAILHPALYPNMNGKSLTEDYLTNVLESKEVYRDAELVAYEIAAGPV